MIKAFISAVVITLLATTAFAAEENFAQANKVFFGDKPFEPKQRAELRNIVRNINANEEGVEGRSANMRIQAEQAYELRDMDRALYYYNLAWWLDQLAVENYLGLAKVSLALGNREEAMYVGETALGMGLEDADLWGKTAIAYALYWHEQDDALMERAHYFLDMAKRLDPSCLCRYRNEIEALVLMKKFEQAKALFHEATKLGFQFPNYFNAWYVEQLAKNGHS